MMKTIAMVMTAATVLMSVTGCDPTGERVAALDSGLWAQSEWICAADAAVADDAAKKVQRAADGTSWFVREIENEGDVDRAVWMTAGLGVYEIYVNGKRMGSDALKPGFTHTQKTRRSFTYDVTDCLNKDKGERNAFAAEVSAGWWRDKIVHYAGAKSAFRAVLQVRYADGTVKVYGTDADGWKAGVGGPVKHAGIFDGEEYDARIAPPYLGCESFKQAVKSDEFKGEILPSEGGEICRRFDLALAPKSAYVLKGVDGEDKTNNVFGRVHKLRDISIDVKKGEFEPFVLAKGETLVVDFGQNAAAVPFFVFKAAEGTTLTCLPAEMLNDGNGERSRGNDGPCGSVYRENLRMPASGMRAVYTFGKGEEKFKNLWDGGYVAYMPLHTFFGFRYVSVTATDDVTISSIVSIPVTSITKDMELGKLETGVEDVNKLVSNVYWGQLSNYLSVPTDCPQRNERLGWTADTQVFAEAGSFNADTSSFFHKWMRDMRDSQSNTGSFPGVAPLAQYGGNMMRLGWADAGVVVPFQIWKQFGDRAIVDENWEAMEKYVAHVNETKYATAAVKGESGNYQWADWLSYEPLESCGRGAFVDGKRESPKAEAIEYWDYLGACYWMIDADMMRMMADATGRKDAAKKYAAMSEAAKAHLVETFLTADGKFKQDLFNTMQTPMLFALRLGLVEGAARDNMIAALRKNFKDHGDCLQTGFLGTSILMDTLTQCGMADVAYTLLLQHKNPSWLYSVDQGATTIWERWNSYTKEKGFGPVGMNSFNHYAYGAVLAWMYKDMAGIAADPNAPGFRNVIMAPHPDKRIGFVKAEYKTAAGTVKSHWRYEGDKWIWDFTVPEGATADVTLPGTSETKRYNAGTYHLER